MGIIRTTSGVWIRAHTLQELDFGLRARLPALGSLFHWVCLQVVEALRPDCPVTCSDPDHPLVGSLKSSSPLVAVEVVDRLRENRAIRGDCTLGP